VSSPRWAAALDDFATCLARQEELLAAQRFAEIAAYAPPADLGPLPADLAAQARALLARSEELTRRVEQSAVATARQLVVTRQLSPDSRRRSAYIDQKA
jgi:hypothetical protein